MAEYGIIKANKMFYNLHLIAFKIIFVVLAQKRHGKKENDQD